MPDFGVFNDEGLLDGPFYKREAAERIAAGYDADDDVRVAEICHDHPDHAADSCEECLGQEDEP